MDNFSKMWFNKPYRCTILLNVFACLLVGCSPQEGFVALEYDKSSLFVAHQTE